MARRKISMNEMVEAIYQWHQGTPIKGIKRSLGLDRRTIRRYIQMAQQAGVTPGEPFPEEQELLRRLKPLLPPASSKEAPAIQSIHTYRETIGNWLEQKDMTAKQIWRLLKEKEGLKSRVSSQNLKTVSGVR